VLALPHSGALVLPLVDGGVLVGLMLVEPGSRPALGAPARGAFDAVSLVNGARTCTCTHTNAQIWATHSYITLAASCGGAACPDNACYMRIRTSLCVRMTMCPPAGSSAGRPRNTPPSQHHNHHPIHAAQQPLVDGHLVTPGPEGPPLPPAAGPAIATGSIGTHVTPEAPLQWHEASSGGVHHPSPQHSYPGFTGKAERQQVVA
jgi:hypothetical protein